MGFLSGKNGHDLQAESILLVPSAPAAQHAFHLPIAHSAQETFGNCIVTIPPWFEKGWPDSCNHMFAYALEFIEREKLGDMFWMEPDCVPLTADWYAKIKAEWTTAKAAGKRFWGKRFKKPYPGMSGVGIYGENWREVAPNLVSVPKGKAWDMFAAPQIAPHMHDSVSFINAWKPKYKNRQLDAMPIGAVLYHQDKTGALIKQVDALKFQGECFQGKNDIVDFISTMSRFYKSTNASAPQKAAGLEIKFTPCEQVVDHWTGVYEAKTEPEIVALTELTGKKKSITEISAEEFQAYMQKKTTTTHLRPFDPMQVRRIQEVAPPVEKVVAEAQAPSNLTVNDVARLFPVQPAQPDETQKRPGKSKKAE